MHQFWTANIQDPKAKVKFIEYLWHTSEVTDRIKEWAKSKRHTYGDTSRKDYDSPAWAYRQADANGYQRCLDDLEALLTFDQEDE